MKQYKSNEFNPYSRQLIEFATIGVSFAKDVEDIKDKDSFIANMIKTLPLLYSMINNLPKYIYDEEEDFVETFVNEVTYEHLRYKVANILEDDDYFLTAINESIDYSETTINTTISECIMDVYQNVVDLLGIIKSENHTALPIAIGKFLANFHEYFGSKLLEALSAINRINSKKQLLTDIE